MREEGEALPLRSSSSSRVPVATVLLAMNPAPLSSSSSRIAAAHDVTAASESAAVKQSHGQRENLQLLAAPLSSENTTAVAGKGTADKNSSPEFIATTTIRDESSCSLVAGGITVTALVQFCIATVTVDLPQFKVVYTFDSAKFESIVVAASVIGVGDAAIVQVVLESPLLLHEFPWVDAVACHHLLQIETRYSVDPMMFSPSTALSFQEIDEKAHEGLYCVSLSR
ncbi:uncharacterized protein DS421_4g119890 [Arachis hypogaea]|nr:uncharacterized protein DS421_4g119890 [Arachis hypogaea]